MKSQDNVSEEKKKLELTYLSLLRHTIYKYRSVTVLILIGFSCFFLDDVGKMLQRYRSRSSRLEILSERINGVTLNDLINIATKYSPTESQDSIIKGSITNFVANLIEESKEFKKYTAIPLLCATFINSDISSYESLTTRLTTMIGECDWAIFVYGGNMTLASEYEGNLYKLELPGQNRIVIFQYNSSRSDILIQHGIFPTNRNIMKRIIATSSYNMKIFPKPMLMMNLLTIIDRYQFVWVFDGDISISSTNITRLLTNIKCSFDSVPFVSQSLVYENTQVYEYLNYDSWLSHPNVIAAATGFIEIQAPIFQAPYLDWYLRNVVGRVLWASHILGADWGFDSLFCRTASYFAEELAIAQSLYSKSFDMNNTIENKQLESLASVSDNEVSMEMNNKRGSLRGMSSTIDLTARKSIRQSLVPCAVIVDGSPVHHTDNRAIDKSIGYNSRKMLNREMTNILIKTFPAFMLRGLKSECNPLDASSQYLISTKLIDSCLESKFDQIGNIYSGKSK